MRPLKEDSGRDDEKDTEVEETGGCGEIRDCEEEESDSGDVKD